MNLPMMSTRKKFQLNPQRKIGCNAARKSVVNDIFISKVLKELTDYRTFICRKALNAIGQIPNTEMHKELYSIFNLKRNLILPQITYHFIDTIRQLLSNDYNKCKPYQFKTLNTFECPANDISLSEAFYVSLNLAVYYKQHPNAEHINANDILRNPSHFIFSEINIPAFYNDLCEHTRKHLIHEETSIPYSYPAIYSWLCGQTIPTLENIYILCDYFSCDIEYLFGELIFKTKEAQIAYLNTGLTEQDFCWFADLSDEKKLIINLLLESNEFQEILDYLISSYVTRRGTIKVYNENEKRYVEYELKNLIASSISSMLSDAFSPIASGLFKKNEFDDSMYNEFVLAVITSKTQPMFSRILDNIENHFFSNTI